MQKTTSLFRNNLKKLTALLATRQVRTSDQTIIIVDKNKKSCVMPISKFYIVVGYLVIILLNTTFANTL